MTPVVTATGTGTIGTTVPVQTVHVHEKDLLLLKDTGYHTHTVCTLAYFW